MIQNISIACDAVFGAGSENFGTVTGNVTFQNGSANSGTVNGNATFNGNAENKAGATVSGDATFAATAVNNGTVTGTVTVLPDESVYTSWLAGNVGVSQYTGDGPHNGQWAFNTTEYASEYDAFEAKYQAWLPSTVGASALPMQYSSGPLVSDPNTTGPHDGQWAWNGTAYQTEAAAWFAYIANTGGSPSPRFSLSYGQYYFDVNSVAMGFDASGNKLNGFYQTGVNSVQDAWPQIDDGNGNMIDDPSWTPTYHDEGSYSNFVDGVRQ